MKGIYKVSGTQGTYIAIVLLKRAKFNDIIRLEVRSHGKVHQMNVQPWEAQEIIQGFRMALNEMDWPTDTECKHIYNFDDKGMSHCVKCGKQKVWES